MNLRPTIIQIATFVIIFAFFLIFALPVSVLHTCETVCSINTPNCGVCLPNEIFISLDQLKDYNIVSINIYFVVFELIAAYAISMLMLIFHRKHNHNKTHRMGA